MVKLVVVYLNILLLFSFTVTLSNAFLTSIPRWVTKSRNFAKYAIKTVISTGKSVKKKKILDKDLFIPQSTVSALNDNSSYSFTVFGEPQSLERHRTLKTGVTYNPSSQKQKLFLDAASIHLPKIPFEGSLEVNLLFYFVRPKNHYYTGKNSAVLRSDKVEKWQNQRKDVDNLVKFVLDSLNKVAYNDDSQISILSAGKLYAAPNEASRIEVKIRKLANDDNLVIGNFK